MNCSKSIWRSAASVATAAVMALLLAFGAEAAEQRSKDDALRVLMTLIKADTLASQIFQQTLPTIVPALQATFPDLPER